MFKLYAGGMKSKHDALELLRRNPEVDLDALRTLCAVPARRRLEAWLREVQAAGEEA